ncbi:hypothetical protein LUX33_24645 [Actinomadura madurae]|uniref:hypothetical protein n=1 Tax=Actinomadura madurae TaxID=1993 RepID=UPI0020D24EF8|nr:hypothetical protein [Actinomadura madurae]MCP9951295.1 hypothetical protein [Actinomadura madurae]MCP9968064.1 hypothetical protein [Actinomadura madurae]
MTEKMGPDLPEQCLLHEAFLWSVDRDADAEALRVGGESISYGRLHERALRLAGGLLVHDPGGPAGRGGSACSAPAARTCTPACSPPSTPVRRPSRSTPPSRPNASAA